MFFKKFCLSFNPRVRITYGLSLSPRLTVVSVTPCCLLCFPTQLSADRTTGPWSPALQSISHSLLSVICLFWLLCFIPLPSHSVSLTTFMPPSSFSLCFLLPTRFRKQFTCQAESSVWLPVLWFNGICVSMCVHGWGITTLAKMLSITPLEQDLWLAAVRAILGLNSARGELTLA